MHFYELYFSPTGGTKKAADALSSAWNDEVIAVDILLHPEKLEDIHFEKGDVCLAAVPSYGGRVPGIVIEHLKKLNGGGAYAIAAAVFGNRHIDDTLTELSDTLTACGFRIAAAAEAVAEHSLIHKFASGRPDKDDIEELHRFSDRIRTGIEQNTIPENIKIPGNHEYKTYNGVPFKPITTGKCTKCGLCADQCPVHAIPKDNPKITDNDVCISCMHCVAACPHHARKLSTFLTIAAGFKMRRICAGHKENKLYIE